MSRHPYADPRYVASVAGDAEIVHVEAWSAPVLVRRIPGTGRRDAAGCAPLTPLARARDLRAGLEALRHVGAISAVLVADPVFSPALEDLDAVFPMRRAFKTHYLIDRGAGPVPMARRHRREIAKATAIYDVRLYDLAAYAAATTDLYLAQLALRGVAASRVEAAAQISALAALPGTRAAGAFRAGALEAAIVFVSDGRSAYSHIAGTSEPARLAGAHHACYAAGIAAFPPDVIVDLGGVPGLRDDPTHGLALFKKGFANVERTAWLLGAVLDEAAYASLAHGRSDEDFFPAYRAPV